MNCLLKKIVVFAWMLPLFVSCQTSKNNQSMNHLYNTWQLVGIKKADKSVRDMPTTGKKILFTFTPQGEIRFNLDVNSCSGAFKAENGTFSVNATEVVCTEMCCDTLKINLTKVKAYKVSAKKLQLISAEETYHFTVQK